MQQDAPDTGLFTPLEFAPTRQRQNLALAVLLVLGGLGLAWAAAGQVRAAGWVWRLAAAAAVLLPCVLLARVLWRHAGRRGPVLRLDARGISGALLQPPVPWDALEDAQLERGGVLRLQRRADAEHPDQPSGWLRRNPARPRVSLHLLSLRQQDIAYDAIHARLDVLRQRAGTGEAASRRAARAEEAFETHLDALVPTPWALYTVVAANVLVWAMNWAAGLSPVRPLSPELFAWGANAASAVVLDGQWWRLLTATFLHGGIVHLTFNMLGLWEAGKQLCRLLGNGQFALVYGASALAGSAASLHYAAQNSVSVGASGAVFGVLGALLTASWHYRHLVPATNLRRLWTGLGFFVGYSLLHGFTQENVDNAAHVGGLACGMLLGLLLLAPIDRLADGARRRTRAAAAGGLALAAIGYGVLATPIPTVWHGQLYAAQEVLPDIGRRFDQAFRQLALEGQRLQRGEIRQPAFLENAERAVAPVCTTIVEELAPLRVPQWDQTGQLVQMYQQICAITARSLALEQAIVRRDPNLPADAQAQLARLSGEMQLRMRQLAEASRRAALPTRPQRIPRAPASQP
ncbi:rhomboid family intramembrane serine protease [Pseudorhodoferax sp.]|uniref:rhomboid family intramembrane serine protease n=1 Tax=Pseudorhodoferax sp. TaxID=1993553 RepID=UPI002DD66C4D|nr:rhomboid family intramembrane serine protease [Pseudorhodoferax sp.]